jgi:hypothetical protein
MNAQEMAKLIETKILTQAGLKSAQDLVSRTSKDSAYLAEHQAALIAAQARWDSEAPVREAREKLEKAGWRRSDYDPRKWFNRKTTKVKVSLIAAIRESGLAQ